MIYFRARELAMDHLGVGSRVDVDYDELGWWPARVAKCAEACVLVVAPDGTWSEKIPWDDVEHRCRAPRETRADRPASVSAARAYPGVETGCSIGASFSRGPSYRTQSTPPSRVSTEAYFTPSTHARNPSGVCIMSPGANPKGAQWSTPSSWVMYVGPFFLPPFLPPFLGGMTLATRGLETPARVHECDCRFRRFRGCSPRARNSRNEWNARFRLAPSGSIFWKRRSDSHVVFPTPSQRADVRAPHS